MQAFRNRSIIAALEGLLEMAKRGDLVGFAFVIKTGPHQHHAGAGGDYERFPDEALSATLVLKWRLMRRRLQT